MRYLLLICGDESRFDAEDLRRRGRLIVAQALQRSQAAATVRVRNGKVSVTDGPFAPTREQLGGFYLIEARDLNEAIQVAARIPSAPQGCVEVRPVRETEMPDAPLARRP